MKVLFYSLFGVFGLLGAYFVISSLFGRFTIDPLPELAAKLCLLVAACAGGFLFYRAYLIGELEGRWGAGVGMVLLGFVVFEVIPVVGMLAGGLIKKLG